MQYLIALVALTGMEIVLGIDNIVFVAILTGRLPPEQQSGGRRLGLGLAMIMRILLLLTLSWILGLTRPLFRLSDLSVPETWLGSEVNDISAKDLILLGGGLFLIWKSVHEIHLKVAGEERQRTVAGQVTLAGVLVQVAIMDIIFSLDSVITAIGMVRADRYGIWVMIAAVILAVAVMMVFAGAISRFVETNPTLKILALSFLLLIGVMLVAEGVGTYLDKGYIYFAMAFALAVEMINLRVRGVAKEPLVT